MALTAAPDPAGVFPSDVHRRVMANLPGPGESGTTTIALIGRLGPDAHNPFSGAVDDDAFTALSTLLAELERAGHAARRSDGGWAMTGDGLAALTGPIADEPPPLEGEELARAEAENEQLLKVAKERARRDRIRALREALAQAEAEESGEEPG